MSDKELVSLGKSTLKVPNVCLGTMTWGEQNTEAQAHEQLNHALHRGLNFIDTAEMYPVPTKAETYTRTESYIGSWLKSQKRSDIILATKVAGPGRTMAWVRGHGDRASVGELSKKDIILACEASLKRLNTDHVDLYQIHWPARYTPMFGAGLYDPINERECTSIQEQIEAMDQLTRQGKIKAWGVSNETPWGVSEFSNVAKRLGVAGPATIQNVYNAISREFDLALIETCRHESVSLLAYSPLAFGFLTGKYRNGAQPSGGRLTLYGASWPRYLKPEIGVAVEQYAELAKQSGLTLTQLALGFCVSRSWVASTIIGATSIDQLDETIDACQTPISDDLFKAINAIHRLVPNPAP